MKAIINTIVSVIVFFAAVAGVRYLIGAVMVSEQVRTIEQRADKPDSEPVISVEEARTEFMLGCDDGSFDGALFDQTVYCGCMFNGLMDVYGVNELLNLSLTSTEEEIEELMTPYTTTCITEQGLDIDSV